MTDSYGWAPTRGRASPPDPEGERYRETVRVTLVGSVVDLFLSIVKITVGFFARSHALIADGIHSLSDLATDAVVIYAAKHGSRSADEEHPYGHRRIETMATVGLGIVLIATALGITVDAIRRLLHPELLLVPGSWALVIAIVSIITKEGVYHYTIRAAKKHRSAILRANAWHSRTDALSSVIVVVGIAGTMVGLRYLDAIAAIGVALMIAKIGWDFGWQSVRELIDTALDPDRVDAIRQTIEAVGGVKAMHLLRSRRMGDDALVDVHIQVDPTLSVSEGHQISETVRAQLIDDIEEVSDVMVHIDTEDDETSISTGSLPLRGVIQKRLDDYFRDIEPAQHIEKTTLHYLDGHIRVELLLPLEVLPNKAAVMPLRRRFNEVVASDSEISSIELHFY